MPIEDALDTWSSFGPTARRSTPSTRTAVTSALCPPGTRRSPTWRPVENIDHEVVDAFATGRNVAGQGMARDWPPRRTACGRASRPSSARPPPKELSRDEERRLLDVLRSGTAGRGARCKERHPSRQRRGPRAWGPPDPGQGQSQGPCPHRAGCRRTLARRSPEGTAVTVDDVIKREYAPWSGAG